MATILGKHPHTPRQIPVSNLQSQKMNDVIAVLSDPFFLISDAQHELHKRKLKAYGCKEDLLQRLFEALEAEHADGWTLGYLLNTKILPSSGKGRDPRTLIGYHVEGYRRDGDGVMILELSDDEDVTILSNASSGKCAEIKMDYELFWALHTLDGLNAVPRKFANKPPLITKAVTGVRKDRWGKEAGAVFGLKLEGMSAISFFFLAGEASMREDRVCGDVWPAGNEVLRQDISMLHGGNEMEVEQPRKGWAMEDEVIGWEEDMRGLHGH